jgi:hypothetical protein
MCTDGVCSEQECCSSFTLAMKVLSFSLVSKVAVADIESLIVDIALGVQLSPDQVFITSIAYSKAAGASEQQTDVAIGFIDCTYVTPKPDKCIDAITGEVLVRERLEDVRLGATPLPDPQLEGNYILVAANGAKVGQLSLVTTNPLSSRLVNQQVNVCKDEKVKKSCGDSGPEVETKLDISVDSVSGSTWVIGLILFALLAVAFYFFYKMHKAKIKKFWAKTKAEDEVASEEGLGNGNMYRQSTMTGMDGPGDGRASMSVYEYSGVEASDATESQSSGVTSDTSDDADPDSLENSSAVSQTASEAMTDMSSAEDESSDGSGDASGVEMADLGGHRSSVFVP